VGASGLPGLLRVRALVCSAAGGHRPGAVGGYLFNRGKSGIKFLEYTAIGAATVCSRVPAYLDSVGESEGLLVGVGEWEEALTRLVTDEALRRQLAGAAREV